MNWLLFYDWGRWLHLPKYKVYGLSVLLASGVCVGAWGIWSEVLKPKQQQLIEQLSSRQHEHLIYLKKLELLAQPQPDYQAQYQQLLLHRPVILSKVDLFNYVSTDFQSSSALVTLWQWDTAPNSQRLTIGLRGEFSAIRRLVKSVLSYSNWVTLERMTLERDSVHANSVDGQFVFAFFIEDEKGEQ
ncbi:hypothetical protein [Vibrio ezurae]|uniref:Uncharacterized protein n=1 Tax=Vibrio ezurae NBRC 102218 TaxID=1219080 RepID=U3CR52_9VIBR|nr:hypothetical protein [Vibrio ezurae]GAD80578.1 hypothetical protein VEZ01S_37_01430 [Vibrio ezurae NBRC 102218]